MIKAPKDVAGTNQFELMLDELGEACVRRHLQVSRQQIAAWRRPGAHVPRAVVLALYWETRWGRSLVDAEREAELSNLLGLTRAQAGIIKALKVRIDVLYEELWRSDTQQPRCANDLWFDLDGEEMPKRPGRHGAIAHTQMGEFWQPVREIVDKKGLTR